MKRIPTVFLASTLLLIALFVFPFSLRVTAQETRPEGALELIVQTDGSPEALSGQVQNLGGSIEFIYENVPAMVISLPAGQVNSLAGLPGVVYVEKNRLVYLANEPGPTRGVADFPADIAVEDLNGVAVEEVDPAALGPGSLPAGYVNFTLTGADQVWEQTGYGSGSVVAVVDTGTAPNVCLSQAVIGAPGYPDGYNATGDGIPANNPQNHWHGTHVGGVIASACALDFSAFPDHPLYQAIHAFLPWSVDFVPVFGQAPLSQIYPVKVFDISGGGTPVSVVLKGLDHVLTLKKGGQLDIDVVNLSLSGPTLFDGRNALDRFIDELSKARITVVSSASNYGPLPNTIGSPATSFASIAAGALDYAQPSRVLYEYMGLLSGFGNGQGLIMRPSQETRLANFSARGPMSDGRIGPDLTALGAWTFEVGPRNELRWASGTSFSAPTVSGVVALLNAYYEYNRSPDPAPSALRNALLLGADSHQVGKAWRGINDQGYGALNAQQALKQLNKGKLSLKHPKKSGRLRANILKRPVRGQSETFTDHHIKLGPGEKYDAIFNISRFTSRVTIEVTDIKLPDNSASALWPNALEVYVQSATRSALDPALSFPWRPYQDGSKFSILIEDGPWSLNGEGRLYQPFQPGLMKVTLIGGPTNQADVSFKLRVIRENRRKPLAKPVAEGVIKSGNSRLIPVTIPAGVSRATFDLVWIRDWSRFPSSDIDMIILDPSGQVVSTAGATLNAPERAVVENPVPGQWQVLVQAAEMYRPDNFKLYLRTE
jgi:subtilisin family serine protease